MKAELSPSTSTRHDLPYDAYSTEPVMPMVYSPQVIIEPQIVKSKVHTNEFKAVCMAFIGFLHLYTTLIAKRLVDAVLRLKR